jgi:glycerophosphoryl diester phosphodiesterase
MLHRNRGFVSGQQIVAATVLQELYRPQNGTGRNRYALGFNVMRQDASGLGDRIRHTGASGTFALLDFKQDLIVVMLSQVPTKQTQPFGDRVMKAIDSIFLPQSNRIAPQTPDDLQSHFQPKSKPLPFVSAHRGGAQRGYPENCIATFEKTLQSTPAIMEIDPRYTKDGAIVLHHDATLDRTTTGTGRVADYTLAELKTLRLKDNEGTVTSFQIPTLEEAFQWANGKTILVLDQKDMPAIERVRKITEHSAEAYVMLIVNSFKDAQACFAMNPNIMMEVMIPTLEKAKEFDKLGVTWHNVVAFVGHTPPEDRALYEYIHSKGASCMIGTSRNLDRTWSTGKVSEIQKLESDYRAFLDLGADIIETDIPTQIGPMLSGQSVLSPIN